MKKDFSSTAGLMTTLRAICGDLPGAEEYVMVHHPAFRVGKKPFVIAGLSDKADKSPTLSVNLGAMMQGELLDDSRFEKTPYIGRHGWVTLHAKDSTQLEIEQLVLSSWQRVAGKKHLASKSVAAAKPKPRKK